MTYRLVLALLCAATLLAPPNQAKPQAGGGYVLKGRVVGESGVPVGGARVILQPAAGAAGGPVRHYLTDAEGRFRISLAAPSPAGRQVLYVVTGLPRVLPFRGGADFPGDLPVRNGIEVPITPPFPSQLGKISGSFSGTAVTLKEGQETDVGDVPVQVKYSDVSVELLDEAGAALARGGGAPGVLFRVHDSRGDVVAEGRIPPATLLQNGSAAVFALPEGIWNVEFALDREGRAWRATDEPLVVRSAGAPLHTSVRLSAVGDASAGGGRPKAYRSPEEARNELNRRGFGLDQDSFVRRAEMGNAEAVELYLDAGVSPAGKDARGTTALIAAAGAGNAEVVKALLERGADANAADGSGLTALTAAASRGSLEAVKALLNAGADVNAKARNGVTALIVAAGNDHPKIVEALLAAGADVNARDKSGMTALSFAAQADNKDIVELLRKAGAQD